MEVTLNEPLKGIRVSIIGAGLAGLAAAKYTKQLGADVVVLEARGRFGGRVLTDRSMGAPVDLGAAAIHGASGNPLTVLAAAAAAETAPLDYDSIIYYRPNGALIGNHEANAAIKYFEGLQRSLRVKAIDGESLAHTIERIAPYALQDPLIALHAGVEFEFDVGGSLEEIGAKQLSDYKPFKGVDLILPRGFDQLPVFLARGLKLHTGVLVERVTASKRGIRLSASSGTIDADYCVCTVPIGVLKSQSIKFDPGLPPSIANAIDRIGAGHVTKIALRFNRVFWDSDRLYVGYASGQPGRFPYALNLHAIHPTARILVTFALGDHDVLLRRQSDHAIAQHVLAMLRDIYGNAVDEPSDVCVTRWNSDPLTQCSYSFALPNTQRADFDAFGEAVGDRIVFAGEHTIGASRGTAHGAYLSGKFAAKRIAKLTQRTG